MQNLPRLSFPQFASLVIILTVATVALEVLPLGAQVEPAPPQTPATPETPQPPKTEAPPAETPAPPIVASPAAGKLFEEARKKLRTRMYSANIVQRLNFPNRTLEATGRIVCGQKFRMRLEFEIKTGATVGQLLQVCDGDKLWTQRQINEVIRLTEQDVRQILREARLDEVRENMVVAEMGLGGITSLLAALDRNMTFGEPQTEKVDGEELSKVEGQWNAQFLAAVKQNARLAKGLPQHIPDGARVYFDQDDFPRRIQYLKKAPKSDVMHPLVTLDFRDVKWLNEEDVQASDFEYHAPDRVIPIPVTEKYLLQLKAVAQP